MKKSTWLGTLLALSILLVSLISPSDASAKGLIQKLAEKVAKVIPIPLPNFPDPKRRDPNNQPFGERPPIQFQNSDFGKVLELLATATETTGKLLTDLWDSIKIEDLCESHKCITREEADQKYRELIDSIELERNRFHQEYVAGIVANNHDRIAIFQALRLTSGLAATKQCQRADIFPNCLEELDLASARLVALADWSRAMQPTGAAGELRPDNQIAMRADNARKLVDAERNTERQRIALALGAVSTDGLKGFVEEFKRYFYCRGLTSTVRDVLERTEEELHLGKKSDDIFIQRESSERIKSIRKLLELVKPVCESHTEAVVERAQRLQHLAVFGEPEATIMARACKTHLRKNDDVFEAACGLGSTSQDFAYAMHLRIAKVTVK